MYSQKILRLGTFSSKKNGEYDVDDDGNVDVVIDGFIIVSPVPSLFLFQASSPSPLPGIRRLLSSNI
jgi:hypothetical protein